jgi:hypothetical protein
MRSRTILGISTMFLAAATVWAGTARAEDEFDCNPNGASVTVQAKGDWHINQQYPWKVVVTNGSNKQKLDASKFALAEKTASLSGIPSGHVKLSGAVCEQTPDGQSACKMFTKEWDN